MTAASAARRPASRLITVRSLTDEQRGEELAALARLVVAGAISPALAEAGLSAFCHESLYGRALGRAFRGYLDAVRLQTAIGDGAAALAGASPELEGMDRHNQALKNGRDATARALAVLVHGGRYGADAWPPGTEHRSPRLQDTPGS
jgi:hypothetical protein